MAERFDEFMERALYGPAGFYTLGRGAGGRGRDFITSPEVGPLFGLVVARWLDEQWDRLGRPDPFVVHEWGSGRGTLHRAVRRGSPECEAALRYVEVEHDSPIPDAPAHVTLANELLDNLPARVVRREREIVLELFVDEELPEWRPVQLDDPPEPVAGLLARDRRDLSPIPLAERAREWVRERVAKSFPGGAILAVDYMASTSELEARDGAWIRTYRDHGRGAAPWESPGSQDITLDVPVDQLAAIAPPHLVTAQAEWLSQLGITELVESGKRRWDEEAHAPGLAAMEGRSRVSEAEALLDPAGLGGFTVIEWRAARAG